MMVRTGFNTNNNYYGSDGPNEPGLYQPWMVAVRPLFTKTVSATLFHAVKLTTNTQVQHCHCHWAAKCVCVCGGGGGGGVLLLG